MLPRHHHHGPRHVAIIHAGQRRPETEASGSRRKLPESENGVTITRLRRFLPRNRPKACRLSRYALAISPIWPPDMLPSDTQTRGDPKRKLTQVGGSRRKRGVGKTAHADCDRAYLQTQQALGQIFGKNRPTLVMFMPCRCFRQLPPDSVRFRHLPFRVAPGPRC